MILTNPPGSGGHRAKWGAITVVVVAQPVLGKTMQVSTERSLGTVAGGLLGFVCVLAGRSMLDIDDLLFSGKPHATVSSLLSFPGPTPLMSAAHVVIAKDANLYCFPMQISSRLPPPARDAHLPPLMACEQSR